MSQPWFRRLAAFVALALCGTALVLAGCRRGSNKSDLEEGYLKQVTITGHSLVKVTEIKATTGIFVGPRLGTREEVRAVISGPKLKVSPPAIDVPDTVFEAVADGVGFAKDGTECHLQFRRFVTGNAPFSSWDLTKKQRDEVASGAAEVVEVAIGCPFDT